MLLTWTPQAWEDYLYWQHTDKRTVKRMNCCVMPCETPLKGWGSRNRSGSILPDAGRAVSIRKIASSTKWTNEAKP